MRIDSAPGPNFATYLAARLIFVTVILGVAALFNMSDGLSIYGYIFAANALLSLGAWKLHHKQRASTYLRWFVISAAVIIDTGVLQVSGGSRGEFVFLYFFSVAAAGLLLGTSGSLWVAMLSTAGITWLDAHAGGSVWEIDAIRIFGFAVNFLLTALLSSAMFKWIQRREDRHRATLGELVQTKLDTQAILDCLSTGLLVVGDNGSLLYTNPSGIDILGLPAGASKADVERYARATGLTSMKVEASPGSRREVQVRTGGGFRPIGFSVSPLGTSESPAHGRIVLFNDLSSVKERERQELDRERLAAVGALSRDLAHEIRNPLATVQGCIEMLTASSSISEDHKRYLQLALKESDRLNQLIADFLVFAHLGQPKKEPTDLNRLIRSRLGKISSCEVKDRLVGTHMVEVDPDQVGLIVDGILLALAEWSEQRGTVRLEHSPEHTYTRFVLEECVIPNEWREAVFRPLSGAEKRTRNLALPTALKAVHNHGGTLRLESAPSVGTMFELSI